MKDDVQDKRKAALKATLDLVAERGFQGAPMSLIAQRADIGVGTIYRYFSGKDDLINALYIDIKTRLAQYIVNRQPKNVSIQERFIRFIRSTIEYFVENPPELFFTEQYENSPLITMATRAEAERVSKSASALIENAMLDSAIKELPLEIIGALISSSTIALAKICSSEAYKPDEDILTKSIVAIWDMISR